MTMSAFKGICKRNSLVSTMIWSALIRPHKYYSTYALKKLTKMLAVKKANKAFSITSVMPFD